MAQIGSGWRQGVWDLLRSVSPLAVRDLRGEIEERLGKIPTRLNEYGFDAWGMQPASLVDSFLVSGLLYRWYFRVEVHGAERLPKGSLLLIGNHAGQLPFDAMMLGVATLLEANPPRIARGMGEYWIPRLPFVSELAARAGQLVGTPENCVQLLEAGECVMAFPEGVRGMNKPFRLRHELMRFGLGFMRLALESGTPIVPVGIVGSDEQQPGLANLEGVARMLGIPALPITPTFPWLGPLGLWPLPVKYRIYFGEPLRFEGSAQDEDAAMEARVDEVRSAIARLLADGRASRAGIFT
jgi:1-acyl-sn-glycerol-3-phosphate acyltransferase